MDENNDQAAPQGQGTNRSLLVISPNFEVLPNSDFWLIMVFRVILSLLGMSTRRREIRACLERFSGAGISDF